MQIVLKLLFQIVMSLATEKVLRELIAVALEQITRHTNTPVDDQVAAPIIKALRGDS